MPDASDDRPMDSVPHEADPSTGGAMESETNVLRGDVESTRPRGGDAGRKTPAARVETARHAANSRARERAERGDDASQTPDMDELALSDVSPELLLQAVHSANNMICIVDLASEDQPLVFVNRYFVDYLGYDPSEIIGQNCRFLQFKDGERDDDQAGLDTIRETIAKRESCVVQLRNYTADGDEFINELYLSPIRAQGGTITHYVGVQNDVTHRARLQSVLRKQMHRFGMVLDSAPTLIGLVRWANDRWEHVLVSSRLADYLGCRPEESEGKSFYEIGYPRSVARHLDDLCSEGRAVRTRDGECTDVHRLRVETEVENETRVLEIKSNCVTATTTTPTEIERLLAEGDLNMGEIDHDLWCYTVEDLTDWVRTRNELDRVRDELANVQVIEQQRIGRDLHDGAAQETLALMLHCKMLEQQVATTNPDLVEPLRQIRQMARRANSHTRRAIRGLLPPEVDTLGLANALSSLIDETNGSIDFSPDTELSPFRLQIEQKVTLRNESQLLQVYRIVSEALNNAQRHAKAQNVIVRLSTPTGQPASEPGDLVTIDILDDGEGFPSNLIGADGAVARETLGFGLRSMSIRAVDIDGRLTVQTEPGVGTRVRLEFPLQSHDENPLEETSRFQVFVAGAVNSKSDSSVLVGGKGIAGESTAPASESSSQSAAATSPRKPKTTNTARDLGEAPNPSGLPRKRPSTDTNETND